MWIPRRRPVMSPPGGAETRREAHLLSGAWGALWAADAENGWGIIHSSSTGGPECLEEIVEVTQVFRARKHSISLSNISSSLIMSNHDQRWLLYIRTVNMSMYGFPQLKSIGPGIIWNLGSKQSIGLMKRPFLQISFNTELLNNQLPGISDSSWS